MEMLQDIWNQFLSIAKEEAGSRVVETWLKSVRIAAWDADQKVLTLEAPNKFIKEWIQAKYSQLFQVHLGRLLYTNDFKLLFIYASETVATLPSKDLITPAYATSKIIPGRVKNALAFKTVKNYGRLNPNYTFDTFIVGPHNAFAVAAARAISDDPGTQYNPFLVYGGSGLGKTHLLHAIGNDIQRRDAKAVVFYQTTDRFVNEFISAIRFNKIHLFQQRYRMVDVLLIDDIQFISNKEQTQEAFFHIFNALYDGRKQIIFSSDMFPRNIEGVEERLRSRLEWGLVADIQKPALETQIAILKKKAASYDEVLTDEVANCIAQECASNVRELEGALVRVIAFASLTKQAVSLELVKKVLMQAEDPSKKIENIIDFHLITNVVCKKYSYSLADLRSNSRAKNLSCARQIAMYLMKKLTNKSLREIGVFLGRKDHSTVIHAFDKISDSIGKDQNLREVIARIETEIHK
jgi:chromosomal replication initiator protein